MTSRDEEWSTHLNMLSSKEGSIGNIISYLENKFDLLEKATLKLEKDFPVYEFVMLPYNDDFLPGQSINDKSIFLMKIFELFFNYSRNLLIKFSMYRDKFIKLDTPQIVNFLSKFPNYSYYLSMIGYDFDNNSKEWKFLDLSLTRERQIILQCITICCCLGYDYRINCLKYLTLTVFSNHRLSIEKVIKENKCEFCEFELDPARFHCTVCRSEVSKMTFFNEWQRKFDSNCDLSKSLSLTHSNKRTEVNRLEPLSFPMTKQACNHQSDIKCENCIPKSNIQKTNHPIGFPSEETTGNDTWRCDCSYINPKSQINCSLCFKENTNLEIINSTSDSNSNSHRSLSEIDINKSIDRFKAGVSYTNNSLADSKTSILPEDKWQCPSCTTTNSISLCNCHICFTENPNLSIMLNLRHTPMNSNPNSMIERGTGIIFRDCQNERANISRSFTDSRKFGDSNKINRKKEIKDSIKRSFTKNCRNSRNGYVLINEEHGLFDYTSASVEIMHVPRNIGNGGTSQNPTTIDMGNIKKEKSTLLDKLKTLFSFFFMFIFKK